MTATLTFDSLKTQLGQYTRDDDPDNWLPLVETVICESEMLLSNLLEVTGQMVQTGVVTLVANDPYVLMPTRWRSTKVWTIRASTSPTKTYTLQQRGNGYLTQFYPFETRRGVPVYYAVWSKEKFKVAPTPAVNYDGEITYIAEWEHLSASVQTTDLTTKYPELLRIACLSHYEIMHRRPEQRADYEKRFADLLNAAGVRELAVKRDLLSAHMGAA